MILGAVSVTGSAALWYDHHVCSGDSRKINKGAQYIRRLTRCWELAGSFAPSIVGGVRGTPPSPPPPPPPPTGKN